MKLFIKYILLIPVAAILVVSCSKKPDVEYTSTYKMSGEWFTRLYQGGAPITSFHKTITYNTADPSSNQIWVDDLGVWAFKAKFNVDYASLTFPAMATTPNLAITGATVKVLEGKVLPGAGHSKSGHPVDSIYLRLEFSDDAGTVYEYKGSQRTGFFEDEY